MQSLLLKTDDLVFEQIKAFLSLLPKDKVEVIDPFEIGFVSSEEQAEIKSILQDSDTATMIMESKRTYQI